MTVRKANKKSVGLVWLLNLPMLGLGNVYAAGLSALGWLIIGIFIWLFIHQHLGAWFAAYVTFSLIGMGEVLSKNSTSRINTHIPEAKVSLVSNRGHLAVNAPDEEDLTPLRHRFEERQKALEKRQAQEQRPSEIRDEEAAVVIQTPEIRTESLAIDQIDFQYKENAPYDLSSYDYNTLGIQKAALTADTACQRCGTAKGNDFSFCQNCGHAYDIG